MFDIRRGDDGTVILAGRLDAASAPVARDFLAGLAATTRIDFSHLDEIASVGLGVLIGAQRRLRESGQGLVLCGLRPHLRDVLDLAGFTGIFEIE
ncbi:MAG: STAS domain-containing protein [Candidatus Krumholzibacteriia bacterium]